MLFSLLNRLSLFLFISIHSLRHPLSGGVSFLNQVPSKLKVMRQGLAIFCFGFLFIPFSCAARNFKHTFPDTLAFLTVSQTSVFKSKSGFLPISLLMTCARTYSFLALFFPQTSRKLPLGYLLSKFVNYFTNKMKIQSVPQIFLVTKQAPLEPCCQFLPGV